MTHLKCPQCGANRERAGFHVRGQFCMCGWRRDAPPDDPKVYLILCTKQAGHGGYALWWGPNRSGYYAALEGAGRYTSDEADRICRGAPGDTLAIHERDALAHAQTVVEYGQRIRDCATTKNQ